MMGIGGARPAGGSSGGSGGVSKLADLQEIANSSPRAYDRLVFDQKTSAWKVQSEILREPSDLAHASGVTWFDFSTSPLIEVDAGYVVKATSRLRGFELYQDDQSLAFRASSKGLTTNNSYKNREMRGPNPFITEIVNNDPPAGPELSFSVTTSESDFTISVYDDLVSYYDDEYYYHSFHLNNGFRISRVLVNGMPIEDSNDFYLNETGLGYEVFDTSYSGNPFTVDFYYYDDQPELITIEEKISFGSNSARTVILRCKPNDRNGLFNPIFSVGSNASYVSFGFEGGKPSVKTNADSFVSNIENIHNDVLIAYVFDGTNISIYTANSASGGSRVDDTFGLNHTEYNFTTGGASSGEILIGAYPGFDHSGSDAINGVYDAVVIDDDVSVNDLKSLFRYMGGL